MKTVRQKLPSSASKKSYRKVWLMGVIFCLLVATGIRGIFFGQIPAGLNRDEAALGYNAYSLLKTGKDEYGKPWPISITSFGDQKLPGYVYTLIPFIAVFHLNTFSIRLPSLLSGFAVIIGMGILALQLGSGVGLTPKQRMYLSFLTMLFIAISPWANHFSRVAYEAHLALALFIFGVVAYQHALMMTLRLHQRIFLIIAALCWASTLLTYHSYHILTPLFIFALLIFDFQRIKKLDLKGILAAGAIGFLAVFLLYKGGVWQANLVKSRGISPFHHDDLMVQATEFRNIMPGDNALYERLLFNAETEAVVRFAQNYLYVFAADFFFVQGSGHGDHNPGGMNNFHPFLAPLVLAGIVMVWEIRKSKEMKRVVMWLLLGAAPAALTIQPQHEVRLSPIFPLISLLGALGAYGVWISIKNPKTKKILTALFIVILFFAVNRMFIQYTFLIPSKVESNLRYHYLARTLAKYQTLGFPVITQQPTSSPYIWYLVENTFDPSKLNQDIERYPVDGEGFIHVKRINNVYFETIKWDDLYAWGLKTQLILVFQPTEVPVEVQKNGHMTLLENIQNENGQVIYQVWRLDMVAPPQSATPTQKKVRIS